MGNLPQRLIRAGAVFLYSAVACLAAGAAHASCSPPPPWSATNTYNTGDVAELSGTFYQSLVDGNLDNEPSSSPNQWNGDNILVCKFTVQPIDVCSSTGTGCAVINSMGQTAASSPNTNLIGFIDPLTGLNAEQAAFAQIGVSMAVAPVVLYRSPSNPLGDPLFEPDYRWLHVCSCDSGTASSCPSISSCDTGSSSVDLLTLTQQPMLSMNPNPPYTPSLPLNPDQTIPNLFFVKVIDPSPGISGIIIKGFSWDSNNGGAIASDSVFTAPFSVGTVAHEIGHMAGWEHTTFGAGPLTCDGDSYCPENLMTAGSAPRQLPNGFIDGDCGANPGQACWVPQIPPQNTMEPSALDLLTTGGAGSCSIASLSQCPSQQAATLLSNFMYAIPNTVSMASQSVSGAPSAQVVGGAAPAAQSGASSSGDPIVFDVSGLTRANPGETLLAYVVIIPQPPAESPQFSFSRNPFKIVSESRRNLLQDFDLQPLDGDVPYPPCTAADVLCGEVEFNRNKGQGFQDNDFMKFSLAILKGGAPVSLADLCGAKVAFIFSDGYAPASVLGPIPCSGSSPLMATSLAQDPTTPPQVVKVSTAVGPGNTPGCTPLPNGRCPNPLTTGVSDSNPATGIEGGALCYSNGIRIQCP
jgi:hypothetical protein